MKKQIGKLKIQWKQKHKKLKFSITQTPQPTKTKRKNHQKVEILHEQTEKKKTAAKFTVPHEIDAEVDAQFNEELVHLAQIGGVSVRVEQSRGGHGVPNVDGDYLGATASRQFENLDVFSVGEGAEKQETRQLILDQLIRRWIRREKGKLGRHGRRHPTHLSLSLSLCSVSVSVSL